MSGKDQERNNEISRKKQGNQTVENINDQYEHRCALEHSEHYKLMQKNGVEAAKKLLLVAFISFIFMAVEAVGGVWSNSLAILTDAAHQLSDVAGFAISFIAVYVTRKPSTLKHNYGYHRADAIGALTTVLIIWSLLIWLLAEAVKRLITPPEHIDGLVMLVTACIGLACNVANLVILQCCFNEEDEEGNALPLLGSIASAYKPHRGYTYSYGGSKLGSRRGSFGAGDPGSIRTLKGTVKSGSKRTLKQQREALLPIPEDQRDDPKEASRGIRKIVSKEDENKELVQKRSGSLTLTKSRKEDILNEEGRKSGSQSFIDQEKQPLTKKVVSDADAASLNANDEEAGKVEIEFEERDKVSSVRLDERDRDIQNMNVRAAIIHMAGDIVQSVGVIIAAVIIYVQPTWTIADPICTFLFSILVLLTTVPIFIDVMGILMETTPGDIEAVDLFNAITALSVVDEIHDFHIYSLGEGKPILSAHVVTDCNPSHTLYKITELLQREFGIYHTTIQVEPNKKSHMKNDEEGVLKCINEHDFINKMSLAREVKLEEMNSNRLLKDKTA